MVSGIHSGKTLGESGFTAESATLVDSISLSIEKGNGIQGESESSKSEDVFG